MKTFAKLESEVRGYCRSFPTVFKTAHGAELVDEAGKVYIDFLCGAGALNYGHNPPEIKQKLLDYLMQNGVTHALDMATVAKREFLQRFDEIILRPRGLTYKIQFTGPTGTNAVEAALKLARKVTGRHNIISFTNAFHGMTLGSLGVTGNGFKRQGAGLPLSHSTSMPFDGFLGAGVDTMDVFEAYLNDSASGMDKPAAVIVETVQGEGGVNAASAAWLKRLRELTTRHEILLIVDDIQVGCGRTGTFFSFEESGIEPDLITLSKSLSGYGLPMAIVLLAPHLDIWAPGEHNGTFRGFNPGFVTATAALEHWRTPALQQDVERKAAIVREHLQGLVEKYPGTCLDVRGRGLIQGVVCKPKAAGRISQGAFDAGLIIETAGTNDEVLKLLPPLTIELEQLHKGLQIIEQSVAAVQRASQPRRNGVSSISATA